MKIGVVLPLETDVETGHVVEYAETRAFAMRAEAAGFDSIWIFDHLLYRYPNKPTAGTWEAWTTLAALAEATTRVELGTLVLCNPMRNPAVLAKMAVTLDGVSGGRLILGLGAGWHKPEFDAFGLPFDHRVDRFAEALQIVDPLLRTGQVNFQGAYYSALDCEILPRGPRPAGPPILIAAFGPRMLRLVARHADCWNTAWLGQASGLAKPRAELDAACTQENRDPASLAVTVGVAVDYTGAETPSDPLKALSGSAEEVAAGLYGHAEAGVSHVICSLRPTTEASLSRLAEALSRYRLLAT